MSIILIHVESKTYLSRRNLRYSEQSCWEPALNQGGRDASKKFLGAYAALCRNHMQPHCMFVILNNVPHYLVQRVILTCVWARKAKSSCSFFISELEPFRCRDKTWCLKLKKSRAVLKDAVKAAGTMARTHNSLCGHEQRLDYRIHEASVAQVDQTGLSRLRLPTLPQKTRAKWVGLGGPGTLIQYQLDLLFCWFWKILRQKLLFYVKKCRVWWTSLVFILPNWP